ncbi:MAG: N-acetylmuramoyl-L-alanine amidase [Solobacterium sp.]|nr:N-acetylmuramoyl-L-alanine amidase [Solobacterium sp.]
MGYSALTNAAIMSPNHSGSRYNSISKITIHHMAGNLSIETCGNVFLNPNRQASSNYGIGSDGRIACYVDEENHPWTSANWDNDDRAITIEVANSETGGDWPISQEAYASLIRLCADICNRYGIYPYYDGTPSATLTEHCMFVATNCPGPTIHAMQVNHVIENDIRAAMAGATVSAPQSTQSVGEDVEDLARRSIAGEFGNGDARRAALGDMYSAVQARINEMYGGIQSIPTYSLDDIARRVITGEFGNGQDRINALAAAGYDNVAVQQRVNEILQGVTSSTQDDLSSIAEAVYRGDYGNGQDRINALRTAGYDPDAVQRAVDQIYYGL